LDKSTPDVSTAAGLCFTKKILVPGYPHSKEWA
jgi:hypothetical protein